MIDSNEKLQELLSRVRQAPWLALDTEADSLHSYPEKLCLLQLSLPGGDELVDPLAAIDLPSLIEALRGRELILHGADYDLRLLYRTFQFVPDAVFDTMVAARFVGLREFGLHHLAEKYLGEHLEKGSQKANWGKRPLTERMERYARNDTRVLQPLADRLANELKTLGRLDWHREACTCLIAECAQVRPRDPEQVWRLGGSERLPRRALAVLREVWHWREEEALKAAKPPYFILSHENVLELAASMSLQSVPSLLPARCPPRRVASLTAAVRRGLNLPAAEMPTPRLRAFYRPIPGEKQRFEELQKRRDRIAHELGMESSFLASRATLVAVARDADSALPELMSWQRKLLELE